MRNLAILVVILCISVQRNYAQQETINEKKSTILSENFTPFGNKAFSNSISNVALSSSLNEGENAKIELKYLKNFWTLGLSADQKLSKGAKQATFYEFSEGISPGTTVSLNVQKLLWNPILSNESFNNFDKIRNRYALRLGLNPKVVTYDDVVKNGNLGEQNEMAAIKLKQPVFFNLKVGFSKTNFAYATDSVLLTTIKTNYITPDVKFSIGLPSKNLKSYLAVIYRYSQSYESEDEQTFYSPFGNSGNYYGQTLSFGSPQKSVEHKVALEWRKNFQRAGEAPDFAINPSITFGLKSNRMAATLPMYFIKGATQKDKPRGLQGGISLGYLTKLEHFTRFKDGFGAQLIVTTPFDVFSGFK